MTCSRKQTKLRIRNSYVMFLVFILNEFNQILGSPVYTNNLAQFQTGRNIRHLPCIVRRTGAEGVCMFAIDCIKSNGTHLGTCIDRFYFGSCCQIKDEAPLLSLDIVENSIDQNTISHFSQTTSTKIISTTSVKPSTLKGSSNGNSSSVLTTIKYKPTLSTMQLESKTESSLEQQHITEGIFVRPITSTIYDTLLTKPPITTTEDSIRLQTFQSVQELTTFPPSTSVAPNKATTRNTSVHIKSTTITARPTRKTTTQLTSQTHTQTKPSTRSPAIVKVPATTTSFKPFRNVTHSSALSSKPPKPQKKPTKVSKQPTTTTIAGKETTIAPKPTTTTEKPQKPTTIISTTNKRISSQGTTQKISTETSRKPVTVTTSTEKIREKTSEQFVTISYVETTKAPRPKPRPTAEITKVPPTDLSHLSSSASTSSISSSNRPTSENTRPTTFTTQPPGLITWTNYADHEINEADNSTELPPEWILIASAKPSSAEASSMSSPLMSQTTSVKFSPSTMSSPYTEQNIMTQRITEIPLLNTHSSVPLTTRFPTRKPQPSETSSSFRPTSVPLSTPTRDKFTKIPTLTTASVTMETTARTTESSKPIEIRTTTAETVTVDEQSAEQTTLTKLSEMKNSSYGTTIPKLNATYVEVSTIQTTKSTTQLPLSFTTRKEPFVATTYRPSAPPRINQTYTTIDLLKPSIASTKFPETQSSQNVSNTTKLTSTTTAASTIQKNPTTVTATTTIFESPSTIFQTLTTKTTSPSSTKPTITTTERPFTELPTVISTLTLLSSTISPSKIPEMTVAFDNTTTTDAIDQFTTETVSSTTSISQMLEGMDYHQVCGKRMYPEPRIVGGSKASFGRWPWQISLRQWRTSTYLHKCGAALLNENWSITAAHCVDGIPPSDLLLRLGEYDLAEEEEPFMYQERRVQIVASHPQFDPRTFEYDLALLRFYEPVVFQPNIIPVCVPASDENFIGRTAFVTGWGRLYEDGPLPSVLQEVSVPVINNTLCESMYRNAGYIEHIPHIFICAGWRKGGYDSCEGDSGGPMVIQRDDKRFVLAGVISWGIGCAEPNQPGVYTRISEFKDWINQILQF